MQRTANPRTSVRFRLRPPKRLYFPDPNLSNSQLHYLLKVLRLKDGDELLVFNPNDGEHLARLQGGGLVLMEQTRVYRPLPKKALAFGLFRPKNVEWMIEKVTEAGVTDIYPLVCAHSQFRSIDTERLIRIMVEATEQSGRCELPRLHEVRPFDAFLDALPQVSQETGVTWHVGLPGPFAPVQKAPYGVIIGPEGGFHADERTRLNLLVPSFSLGDLTLRVETACIGAMFMCVP